jgi:hypothetical protein
MCGRTLQTQTHTLCREPPVKSTAPVCPSPFSHGRGGVPHHQSMPDPKDLIGGRTPLLQDGKPFGAIQHFPRLSSHSCWRRDDPIHRLFNSPFKSSLSGQNAKMEPPPAWPHPGSPRSLRSYSLTAPVVNPATIRRWNRRTMRTRGMVTITEAAEISAQGMEKRP